MGKENGLCWAGGTVKDAWAYHRPSGQWGLILDASGRRPTQKSCEWGNAISIRSREYIGSGVKGRGWHEGSVRDCNTHIRGYMGGYMMWGLIRGLWKSHRSTKTTRSSWNGEWVWASWVGVSDQLVERRKKLKEIERNLTMSLFLTAGFQPRGSLGWLREKTLLNKVWNFYNTWK